MATAEGGGSAWRQGDRSSSSGGGGGGGGGGSSSGKFVTLRDSDSDASAAPPTPADNEPVAVVLLLITPLITFYAGYLVTSLVPVDLTDNDGVTHIVPMRVTANWAMPWQLLIFIDLYCFCPAHYWLALYNQTRTVEWIGDGGSKESVERRAAVVRRMTRGETIHYLMTLLPPFVAADILAIRRRTNWIIPIGLTAIIAGGLVGGQLFFGVLTQPRVAILRFRGPDTPAFAWSAMRLCLIAGVLSMVWMANITSFWVDQPSILPINNPPRSAGLGQPATVDSLPYSDLWTGRECRGHLTGDIERPWEASVSDCDAALFYDGLPRHSNATIPSFWTAQRFRHGQLGMWLCSILIIQIWTYQVRFHIIRNARIENVGKSQSCMVSKLRIIWSC